MSGIPLPPVLLMRPWGQASIQASAFDIIGFCFVCELAMDGSGLRWTGAMNGSDSAHGSPQDFPDAIMYGAARNGLVPVATVESLHHGPQASSLGQRTWQRSLGWGSRCPTALILAECTFPLDPFCSNAPSRAINPWTLRALPDSDIGCCLASQQHNRRS